MDASLGMDIYTACSGYMYISDKSYHRQKWRNYQTQPLDDVESEADSREKVLAKPKRLIPSEFFFFFLKKKPFALVSFLIVRDPRIFNCTGIMPIHDMPLLV